MQHAASAAANIGEVLVSQRRFDKAEATLTGAIRDLRAYKLIEQLGFAEIQMGRLEIERGNLEEAVILLSRIAGDAAAGGIANRVVDGSDVNWLSSQLDQGYPPPTGGISAISSRLSSSLLMKFCASSLTDWSYCSLRRS